MKALVCELCGGNTLVKNGEYFICEFCGTKYRPEEARKLFVEGKVDVSGSTVRIDTSEELKNLRHLAVTSETNSEKKKYYDMIRLKDPYDVTAMYRSKKFSVPTPAFPDIFVFTAFVDLDRYIDLIIDSNKNNKSNNNLLIFINNYIMDAEKGLRYHATWANTYDGTPMQLDNIYLENFFKYGDYIYAIDNDRYLDSALNLWKAGIRNYLQNVKDMEYLRKNFNRANKIYHCFSETLNNLNNYDKEYTHTITEIWVPEERFLIGGTSWKLKEISWGDELITLS